MYTSPVNQYKSASEVRWYMSTDVINYLYKLRDSLLFTNCNLVPRLDASPSTMIFGPLHRFPENKLFICEGIGEWNSHLQKIQLLTSIITNGNRRQRECNNINTVADPEITLLDCINDAIQKYESGVDLLDRTQFEHRYQLTWEEEEDGDDDQAPITSAAAPAVATTISYAPSTSAATPSVGATTSNASIPIHVASQGLGLLNTGLKE